MGTWGAGLYEDDFASDLRNVIALVSKIPADGARLAEILLDLHGGAPGSEDESVFWLVAADQFERRGIDCPRVSAAALSVIESGADLARLRNRDADPRLLSKRARVLDELAARLRSPRPPRPVRRAAKPPDTVLQAGEVYAFPTMNGLACSPWRQATRGAFEPDGWGALAVLACGRAFDWFPWCALASLTVDPGRKPALGDALEGRLIFHLQTHGAARCVPKRKDVQTMRLEPLGRILLDPARVAPHISRWPITRAIECDWSISHAGYGAGMQNLPVGPQLASLVSHG